MDTTDKEKFIKWLKAAIIRAVKTMAEGLIILIGTNQVSITSLDWGHLLGVSATMGLVAFLSCIPGLPEVDTEQPVHYDDEVCADDVQEVKDDE